VAWLVAIVWLLAPPGANAAEPRATELTEAAILLDASDAPPPDDAPGWVPLTLPDEWRRRRPDREGFAWYRLELPGPARADVPYAVYLPSLGMNAAVWVNGEPVGSGGSFEEPVARNFNRPLLFAFPSRLLDRTRNVIHVRLWCYATPHHGYLGPLRVGPAEALRPAFEARRFRQIELARASTLVTGILLLLLVGLWVGSRFAGVYGWFVVATGVWAVSSLNYWVRDVPVTTWTWERLVSWPLEGFAVALALWVHRFVDVERPRTERALFAFAAGSALAVALLPIADFYPAVLGLHAASLAIALYAVSELLRRWRRFPPWQTGVYVGGAAFALAFAVHDFAMQIGWLPATASPLLPFVVPIMLICFGLTLTARFVASLRAAESLSRELEQRVEEKHGELERSYARMRDLERAHVLAHERERLMREMHDGLGGHLVSALSLAESEGNATAVTEALRRALDEMRVVIDSLDPEVEDLGQLVALLRARLEPMLRRHGLRIVWDVGRDPGLPSLGPERSLHVLRILQEAITNVVKHASPGEVRIATRSGRGVVTLVVADDGRGRAQEAQGGRGLANMYARAEELGATLRITSDGAGTRVELDLPVTPSA